MVEWRPPPPAAAAAAAAAAASSSSAGPSSVPNEAPADEDYNSADEHGGGGGSCGMSSEELAAREAAFEARLASRGLQLRRMLQDGNCLFRCISDRVYGDAEMHDQVRRLVMDYMEKERDHFSQYVTEDFGEYLRRKRRDRVFGNHLEMQAASEMYARPLHVYAVDAESDEPMNTFQAADVSGDHPPLRLTYHGRNHYNVLFDPNEPDVGVGLGLPGLQPGLADAMQMNSALEASEQEGLEAELLKQAQADSEMEEAQAAIEAAVRAESAAAGGGGGGGGEHSGAPLAAAAGNPAVQQLLAMGFALPRAVQAAEIFGNDLDSCLEFLTAD